MSASHSCDVARTLVRRCYEEMWNRWDFSLADELLAPEIIFRGSFGDVMRGREAFRNYMKKVQSSFPDFHNTIELLVAEDDAIVARLSYRGTHQGEFFGIPPTGKKIHYAGAAFYQIARGRIAEGWVLGDLLGLLRQIDERYFAVPRA
jgi:steroid delta-isomerase-like uncharacterized protein